MQRREFVASLAAAGAASVRDHGAKGDGVHLDTKALQTAIDAVNAKGGGIVAVPPGRYLTGTLYLRSHVTLYLEKGSLLLGSKDLTHYPETVAKVRSYTDNYTDKSLIYAERVERVLTFTGTSMLGPPGAVPLFSFAPTAVEYPPGEPRFERNGDDVRMTMDYGEPVPASGRAQAIAMELDNGRIVILGEAGMLRAQGRKEASRVGMNVPGYDNRHLALNIMHWLSRVI